MKHLPRLKRLTHNVFKQLAVTAISVSMLPLPLYAQPVPPPMPTGVPGPVTTPASPGAGAPLGIGQVPDRFKPLSARTKVTFNLEDAQLPELVKLISSMTGKRFIMPGKSRQISATVYAPTKVTAAEAYQAFLSILQINGMTVVPAGKYLKIIETVGVEQQTTPVYSGNGSPGDDRYITHIYRVDNAGADDIATLLGKFKSKEGSIQVYAPANSLIITDTGVNIRRLMRIVKTLDISRSGEQIWVEPVHYANATDVAKTIEEIFPKEKATGSSPGGVDGASSAGGSSPSYYPSSMASGQGGTTGKDTRVKKIVPDERTNSLIIMATENAYLRILELLRELDRPQEGDGRIHVHYLQHSDAEDVSTTLTSLIGGGSSGGGGGAKGGGQGSEGQTRVFEGQIKISPHKAANALVITSSLHDYAALKKVIDRLDAPRRQVFIEAVVMELAVTRGTKFGISEHGGVLDLPTKGSLSVLGFQAQNSLSLLNQDALTSLALGVRGPTIEGSQQLVGVSIPAFGVALTAIANSSDANVLSTPHLVAMDNQEAEITVGENVPTQTSGGGFGGLGGLGGLAAGAQGAAAGGAGALGALGGISALGGAGAMGGAGFGIAPRQDVGTSIKLTPHLNESDEIRIDISEEISEVQGNPEGTLGVRTIAKRVAKTKLAVKDQQTVVIGGLMRDASIVEKTKIPVLGDIPLLGALFRRTQTTKKKTNLLLILTPYIVRSADDMRRIYERKMRERQEFLDRYFVFNDEDYQPPVDYGRTRGLLAEIANEFKNLEDERKLLEEANKRESSDHPPRPPLGAARETADTDPNDRDEGAETLDVPVAPPVSEEAEEKVSTSSKNKNKKKKKEEPPATTDDKGAASVEPAAPVDAAAASPDKTPELKDNKNGVGEATPSTDDAKGPDGVTPVKAAGKKRKKQ